MNGTKGRLLLLLKILEEKSDSEHYLRSQDLIDLLADMGISAERKTVYSDIEVLCELGYDIVKNGKKGYYLASRKFEQAELMLLADTVAASRFMTEKKSAELIGKIESLSSEYQSAKISRQITVTNRIKSMNESIYYSIDAIHEAIAAKKKISFKYISYASKRSKVFRNNGKPYIVSPYRLICDNENYYLIAGYSAHEDPLTTFRADKMVNVAILDENAEPAKINIGKYVKSLFGMYSGEVQNLVMRFDMSLISVVYDRFGKDINVMKDEETNTFVVSAEAAVSPVFFGWLAQFGSKVKILSPASVGDEYKKHLEEILGLYK